MKGCVMHCKNTDMGEQSQSSTESQKYSQVQAWVWSQSSEAHVQLSFNMTEHGLPALGSSAFQWLKLLIASYTCCPPVFSTTYWCPFPSPVLSNTDSQCLSERENFEWLLNPRARIFKFLQKNKVSCLSLCYCLCFSHTCTRLQLTVVHFKEGRIFWRLSDKQMKLKPAPRATLMLFQTSTKKSLLFFFCLPSSYRVGMYASNASCFAWSLTMIMRRFGSSLHFVQHASHVMSVLTESVQMHSEPNHSPPSPKQSEGKHLKSAMTDICATLQGKNVKFENTMKQHQRQKFTSNTARVLNSRTGGAVLGASTGLVGAPVVALCGSSTASRHRCFVIFFLVIHTRNRSNTAVAMTQ